MSEFKSRLAGSSIQDLFKSHTLRKLAPVLIMLVLAFCLSYTLGTLFVGVLLGTLLEGSFRLNWRDGRVDVEVRTRTDSNLVAPVNLFRPTSSLQSTCGQENSDRRED